MHLIFRMHLVFRNMVAEAGVELTPEEAEVNYNAARVALVGVTDGGLTPEEAVEHMKNIAGPRMREEVCLQYVNQALEIINEQ